jgi:hypothetical protein
MKRKCGVAAIAIMLASACCAPVQAQIDFSSLDKYRGLDNQRPFGGNTGQSTGQNTQDRAQTTAYAENEKGLAAEKQGDWATATTVRL